MPIPLTTDSASLDGDLLIACGAFIKLDSEIDVLAEKAANVPFAHPATRALDAYVAETRPRWEELVLTITSTPAFTAAGRVAKATVLRSLWCDGEADHGDPRDRIAVSLADDLLTAA